MGDPRHSLAAGLCGCGCLREAHGLWAMCQMMFTKYLVVVDDDVDVHNTSEVLFRLCANTDPQRDSIFTKAPADVLEDRKSTRLNSSHSQISYAVFCLKKKNKQHSSLNL